MRLITHRNSTKNPRAASPDGRHAERTFWNGETLEDRLRSLVRPYTKDLVDCAAYTLTIGHEVYVSPSTQATEPQNATVRHLADGEALPLSTAAPYLHST